MYRHVECQDLTPLLFAYIAANYLRENGIDCFLGGENIVASAIAPMAVKVQLMVAEDDVDKAMLLLNDLEAKF